MRRKDSPMNGPIGHDQLKFLAAISPEWRAEKRRREHAAAEAVRQQKHDEFVRAITRPNWPDNDRAVTEDDVDRFVEAITSHEGCQIHEAGWDAAKHPRRGGPPNAGWWASTSGGSGGLTTSNSSVARQYADDSQTNSGAGSRPSSNPAPSQGAMNGNSDHTDRRVKATTAEFSPSQEAPAHLIASRTGGHHWVPQAVFREFFDRMTEDAYRIFQMGTESPELYDHANDTWNGIKHHEYSSALRELMRDWIKENGGKLGKKRGEGVSFLDRDGRMQKP
jgi:hypothetical protein